MDAFIDKLDTFQPKLKYSVVSDFDKSLNGTLAPNQNITAIGLELWSITVESLNPKFFHAVNSSLNQRDDFSGGMSKEIFLYETTDAYLHLFIGKLVHAKTSPGFNRTFVYSNYTEVMVHILHRVQMAIDYHEGNSNVKRGKPLRNIQRNLIYHLNAANIKDMILNSVNDGEELKLHHLTRIPLYIFIITGLLCLGFSSLFHTAYCYSENSYHNLSRLDYGGIALLIAGTIVSPYFYTFC